MNLNLLLRGLCNMRLCRLTNLRLPLLIMGVTNESFYLSGRIHVANYLLKSMQRGNANAEEQFFCISDGTPSGPRSLILSNSNNTFSTSETVNWSVLKGDLSFTIIAPELNGTHESSAYVRSINSAKWSQIAAIPMPTDLQNSWPMDIPLASA
jgi:hypothetical protein